MTKQGSELRPVSDGSLFAASVFTDNPSVESPSSAFHRDQRYYLIIERKPCSKGNMMLPQIAKARAGNQRIVEIDKALGALDDVHTALESLGVVTAQSQSVLQVEANTVARMLTAGQEPMMQEVVKASEKLIAELPTIHERESLVSEELGTLPMTKTA